MNHPALPHTVVEYDTEGSSRGLLHRQIHLDKALELNMDTALHAFGHTADGWFRRIDGDSGIVAAPADVPKDRIVGDLCHEMITALRNFNRMMNEQGRLRVRVAMAAGDIVVHGGHINGTPVTEAARLRDSVQLRQEMRDQDEADLCLILSDQLYTDAVLNGNRDMDPAQFHRVEVSVKDYATVGWIWRPHRPRPGDPRPDRQEAASDSSAGNNVTHVRDVTITGPGVVGSGAVQRN